MLIIRLVITDRINTYDNVRCIFRHSNTGEQLSQSGAFTLQRIPYERHHCEELI